MDPMDLLEADELLRFFRCHKTEMSCMENPHTFLSQLRDHDLVPEDRYKKVSRMKSKNNMKKGLYEILDWLESEKPMRIKDFWRCVLKETIMNQYPALRLLRNSLMDGSFHFPTSLPEGENTEDTGEGKRKEDEEEQVKSVRKKRNLRRKRACDEEEEQAGPSSQLTQKKKSKKISFSSPLKKGGQNDIWTWPFNKVHLSVTCGNQAGTLHRERLAQGEKCIVVDKRWFTPNEFVAFGGKKSAKNWKLSIRCQGTPLEKLIKEGHLNPAKYNKRGSKKAKKSLFPVSDGEENEDEDEEDSDQDRENQVSSSSKGSSTAATDEEEETEEQTEQQPETSHRGQKVLQVTCGAAAGTLHIQRFASGTCGKSIRTETSWLSPVEFIKEARCERDASWRTVIECEGEPLWMLIQAKILMIHSLNCDCRLCNPDSTDVDNNRNDDECYICKSEDESKDEEELVECDHCPRSFHQKCHLPHVEEAILRDERKWMCTFCVFKTTQKCYDSEELETEEVMRRPISQRMLQCQYLLLYLCNADEEQIFATNPCQYLRDYSTVIKTPMWLGHVADKLQEQRYQTIGEFVSDVRLIFANCASYNRDNAEYLAKGNRLKELFDGEFKSVFNISE